MSTKRASLPGAEEFFRGSSLTQPEPEPIREPEHQPAHPPAHTEMRPRAVSSSRDARIQAPNQGSGRQQHEEKVTFYCTREELLALERARLALKEFGVNADRGRVVREALSYTLADLDANGKASILADRLSRRR